MHTLHTYLPQDRLRALAHGESLPDRTHGAALFADISGFTPLTERLTRELGARRGIEELTRGINAVYDALISEIEHYGGSVIDFAGDAITCWFDGDHGPRATASALAMQTAMQAFPMLGLKVAITSGPARRFVVGDPTVKLLDALAGATIARLSAGEHLATSGEVLIDEPTAHALTDTIGIQAWRTADSGERFAVLDQVGTTATLSTHTLAIAEHTEPPAIALQALRRWILPAVFEREENGHGTFLTELRPAVALFVRFSGIDYDSDEEAEEKLSTFIFLIQAILTRYEANLLQLTIGDKGSYLYAVFGAPTAHEDDAHRALQAALDLLSIPQDLPFIQSLQIGLSKGIMRCGAYGGATRRTYGSLGDEVNLAARLMMNAASGEILVSQPLRKAVGSDFAFKAYAPILLKGKSEPVPVFAVIGRQKQRAHRLEEVHYALPMMGRQAELALIEKQLALSLQGRGQVIGIVAEAGMGKSRLLSEVVRLAHQQGFTAYGGACQSSGSNTPYLVWKPIWQAFFDIDLAAPLSNQITDLESKLAHYAPARMPAMPVLSIMLDMPIADNEFTSTLDPKIRRNVLTAVLEDCLKSATNERPLLLVLEDMHWADTLSRELLEVLARADANRPVCFMLAYRPSDSVQRHNSMHLIESLPHFTHVALDQLSHSEAEGLIHAKLKQLFPDHSNALPPALLVTLSTRAEGNPFYIEELLNYLHDRGISPFDEGALNALELPANLHTLILSRIDRLSEAQKVLIKTASIIGRTFSLEWLHGYYPELGASEHVKIELAELANLDLLPLDRPEPELAYLFKHIVTHEVAYESLSFSTRAQLHEQLAEFIETLGPERYLDLIAFHYSLSTNTAKQRLYLQKAGEAAQFAFANDAALDYFARLLPLLDSPAEQIHTHLKRGAVLELMGRLAEAEDEYRAAWAQSQHSTDAIIGARCQHALGALLAVRGDFPSAHTWLIRARDTFAASDERSGLALTHIEISSVWLRQGEYPNAREALEQGLRLARALEDKSILALALNNLGNWAYELGDYAAAQSMYEESLAIRRQTGSKHGISISLNNLGNVAYAQSDYARARLLQEEGLALRREMGDKRGIGGSLNNLAMVLHSQGDYAKALALYEESLVLFREIGDKRGINVSLGNLGNLAIEQGEAVTAQAAYHESLLLCREMGYKEGIIIAVSGLAGVAMCLADATRAVRLAAAAETLRVAINSAWYATEGRIYEHTLASARAVLSAEAFTSAWNAGARMALEEAMDEALNP